MRTEILNAVSGVGLSNGEILLDNLSAICEPNAGEFIWRFGKKRSLDDKGGALIFGLHGDEVAPVRALEILLPRIVEAQSEFRGEIALIIGNPEAVKKGKRGLPDANRIFGKSGVSADHQRVRQIEKAIIKAKPDATVDYHCTRYPSRPFVFVPKGYGNHQDPMVQQLVGAHGLSDIVLADYATYTDSANEVDHWIIEVSKGVMRAMTVEAGCLQNQCDDPDDLSGPVGITIAGVKNVLKALGIFDFGNIGRNVPWLEADRWDIFDGVYSGKGFAWNGVVSNFGRFQAGEAYAFQNGNPLFASEDFSTMFVKNNGDFDPDNEKQRLALRMRRLM